jgi:predicted DsbA family dithiol-disulfide isomerase
MNLKPIRIDIISDVVCPWCYIGKKRIEKAMKALESEFEFEVSYHPFELNPYIPEEGVNQKEYLTEKFGGPARYNQVINNITTVGLQEGLKFDYEKQVKSPNTLKAHRLIWFAAKYNRQRELVELLFSAFFEKAVDLTRNENLIESAVQAGLDRKITENFLNSDEGTDEVKYDQHYYRQAGVTGVPFYIIDGKYGISGAQNPETLIQALRQISTESSEGGESCSLEEGNC